MLASSKKENNFVTINCLCSQETGCKHLVSCFRFEDEFGYCLDIEQRVFGLYNCLSSKAFNNVELILF